MAEEKKAEKKKPAAPAKKKKAGGGKKKGAKLAGAFQVAGDGETKISPSQKSFLRKRYEEQAVPALQSKFKFGNKMQVPHLKKVVVNCGLKDAVGNPKLLDGVVNDLAIITGQKPVVTRARKAIAAFKIRQGLPIGARVTLRHARMYEFLGRLINIALPRVRDFKGVSAKSFDGRGNYSLGVKEHIIFPEINYDTVEKIFGFTVTVETTAQKNEHARELLAELGMPFRK